MEGRWRGDGGEMEGRWREYVCTDKKRNEKDDEEQRWDREV